MLHRLRTLFVMALLAAAVPAAAVGAATEPPKQVLEDYYATLLKAMQGGSKLGYEGRFRLLAPAVDKAFNIPKMAQASVGGYWDKMTDEQHTALVKAFRTFTIANYAHSFDDYSGEKFLTTDQKVTPRKDVIVYTTLVKSDGDKVAFNYLLRQNAGQYKVLDVFLDGSISQIAVRRSEYTAVLREGSPDKLIAAIEKKAADLAH